MSAAGPAPNYDMQRILATRSPREAAKMSGFVSVVLFFPRYMMIAGLTVLALAFYSPRLIAMGPGIDFEMVLPYALKELIPVGLVGVLMAGLLAAFMSTYAATINAAPAYVVNDIYKKFINPDAPPGTYVRLSYVVTIVFVVLGFAFGLVVESINQVTLWIVNALWAGYTAANVLKWYWWRLNGYGYFWGMVTGIASAILLPVLFEDDEVLMRFYMQVRPWGFWKPVLRKVRAIHPEFQPNRHFKRDAFNVAVGVIWQTSLVALPIYLVIHETTLMLATLGVTVATSLILKFTWWDKLDVLAGPPAASPQQTPAAGRVP